MNYEIIAFFRKFMNQNEKYIFDRNFSENQLVIISILFFYFHDWTFVIFDGICDEDGVFSYQCSDIFFQNQKNELYAIDKIVWNILNDRTSLNIFGWFNNFEIKPWYVNP